MHANDKHNSSLMLAVVIGIGFIAAFNENSVNIALVYIQAEYSVSTVTSQWLVTGYMIVSAIVSATCAWMMCRFELRHLIFSAGTIFVVSSLAATIVSNYELLLFFRLVQAIGTGVFVPIMVTTILKVAPKEKMGTLMAVGNMCLTLGPALGPAITGFMISLFGWRSVFVPGAIIMVILLVIGYFVVYNIHETCINSLDIPSIALSSVGLTFFMYGLTQICLNIVASVVTLIVGATILGIFARRQSKLVLPFLNLHPFTNKLFVAACAMLGVAMMISFSTTVLLSEYYQEGVCIGAAFAGALILLPVMCNVCCAVIGGKLFDKFGEFPLLPSGYFVLMLGVIGMCISGRLVSLVLTTIFACVTFVALALIYTATQAAGLKRLSEEEHPHGVSIMNVLVMVAGALGTSLCGGIVQAASTAAIESDLSASLAQGIGFSDAMIVASVFTLFAFIAAFIFRESKYS